MSACLICGGYGAKHDPIAHDWIIEDDATPSHDDVAEVVFETLNACHSEGIHDTLRQAHAVAYALKFAEPDPDPDDAFIGDDR